MPQSEGGYISLDGNGHIANGQAIYQSTTEPNGTHSVLESMKRVLGHVVSGSGGGGVNGGGIAGNTLITPTLAHDTDDLLNNSKRQPVIIGSRERDKSGKNLNSSRMPSAPTNTAEETRLLGSMPVDPLDDIELRSVQLQFPHARGSIIDACDQRRIPTDKGDVLVAIQGDNNKPAILTYHDLGLNYATSFAGFFNYPLMRGLLENFCVYHVTAPGQEEAAPILPEDYIYPTMDELANQLQYVLSHFGLKSVIGFGIGAGANILARFALAHPDKVGAMCLINCVSTQSGWIEWGYQSFNTRFLRTKGMTQSVIDYLMWHHFGRNPEERNHDLVQMYKQHFERGVNPTNLAMFINSYIHRNDLNIARTPPGTPGIESSTSTLKMPIMNITGALSPHVDDTVTFNGRLDPTNSTWMKISDCAMVLEEQPAKLAEAFRLFLQGEGYATPLTTPASSPCGTKYLSYSNIFFANFKEEQERILAEKLQQQQQQQQQQPPRLRTNTRLCRETAITNNNSDFTNIQQQQQQKQSKSSTIVENTNNDQSNNNSNNNNNNSTFHLHINQTANMLYNANSNKHQQQQMHSEVNQYEEGEEEEEEEEEAEAETNIDEISRNINGTLYTNPSVQLKYKQKIRITENPLPEPVTC